MGFVMGDCPFPPITWNRLITVGIFLEKARIYLSLYGLRSVSACMRVSCIGLLREPAFVLVFERIKQAYKRSAINMERVHYTGSKRPAQRLQHDYRITIQGRKRLFEND